MAGRKGSTTAKAQPKTQAPNRQHDLFHFYQKQPKLRGPASKYNDEAAASNFSSGSVSQLPVVLIEDTHANVSISGNKRPPPIAEMDDTVSGSIERMGAPLDYLCPSPCMDPPSDGTEDALGEPGKTSDSNYSTLKPSEPHQAQSAIAVNADDMPTSQILEVHRAGSCSDSPLQRTLHAEVAGVSIVEASPASPQDFGDDSGLATQEASSSNPYKTSSSGKRLPKKDGGEAMIVPDVIDLTVLQDDNHARPRKSAASSRQHHVYVVDDDEGIIKDIPSGSQGAPIDISSSPIESRPSRVIHPFFARQITKKQKDKHTDILSSPLHALRYMQVPWPGAEDQHITGPQTSFSPSSASIFGKCGKMPAPVGSTIPSPLRWLNTEAVQTLFTDAYARSVELRTPTPLERETVVSSLPSSHREHPGISRIFDESHGSQAPRLVEENGDVWSQKWRPRRAAQVLGNEDNALYLKAWLQALALRAWDKPQTGTASEESTIAAQDHNRKTKHPTVVRAVVKRRGRKRRRLESDDNSGVEEWIVDDDEVVESQSGPDDDDWVSSNTVTGIKPSHLSREQHPDAGGGHSSSVDDEIPLPDFSTLTNTILLAGPPGSGKSSTVYACAEELGWEVFEVHPGTGKRSGGSISSLIGDVGKNHHVGRRGAYNTNRPGFGFLAEERENGGYTHLEDGEKGIRQSAILLDEVDVLFKEDANFWPAVVNIIKFSHRPIFMTCNDTSLIPQNDLPLQTCLHFRPSPSPLAVSFLQCVCLAEGHFVPQEQLEEVYAHTYTLIGCDEPEMPPVAFPSQQPPCPDLRQALNTLQFWCSRDLATGDTIRAECDLSTITPGITQDRCSEILADWTRNPDGSRGGTPEERSLTDCDMARIGQHADNASYIDGYLERRPWDVLEALATDRYEPSGDDEVGHTLLHKPAAIGKSRGVAFYNRDADMAWTALLVSRHVFETSGAGTRARGGLRGGERGSTRRTDCRSVVWARVATQTLAAAFLDDVMTLAGPLLPRASVVLDYTPYVGQMILADDALEGAAAATSGDDETRQRQGRRRGWRLGEHQRHMNISAEGAEAARNMLLGWNV